MLGTVERWQIVADTCVSCPIRSHDIITEGSLEVKLPIIWTDEEQRWAESEKRREEKRRER